MLSADAIPYTHMRAHAHSHSSTDVTLPQGLIVLGGSLRDEPTAAGGRSAVLALLVGARDGRQWYALARLETARTHVDGSCTPWSGMLG